MPYTTMLLRVRRRREIFLKKGNNVTYLLIIPIVVGVFLQSLADKLMSLRIKKPERHRSRYLFYNSVACFLSVVVYGLASGAYAEPFRWQTVAFGSVFGLSFCLTIILGAYLIQTGSFAIASLIVSFAPLIPTAFGFAVLSEPLKPHVVIGILLLIASLLFINLQKAGRPKPLWLVLAIVAFFSNGMCSTIQTYHQNLYGNGGVLFMASGTFVSMLITGIYFALTAQNPETNERAVCIGFGAMRGVSNIVVNFLVIYLVTRIPSSVLFPSVSAGGTVFSFLASYLIFKERMNTNQKIGFALGLAAVILLNL